MMTRRRGGNDFCKLSFVFRGQCQWPGGQWQMRGGDNICELSFCLFGERQMQCTMTATTRRRGGDDICKLSFVFWGEERTVPARRRTTTSKREGDNICKLSFCFFGKRGMHALMSMTTGRWDNFCKLWFFVPFFAGKSLTQHANANDN